MVTIERVVGLVAGLAKDLEALRTRGVTRLNIFITFNVATENILVEAVPRGGKRLDILNFYRKLRSSILEKLQLRNLRFF